MNRVRIVCAPLLGVAVASFVLGIAAAPATAKNAPPVGVPAIAQYVETFPTASGPVAAPTEQAPVVTGAPVPARIARKIRAQGGSDSALLEQLAASGNQPPSGGRQPDDGTSALALTPQVEGLPAAVVLRGGSAFVWLVVGILATSAGAAGLAFARRRRESARG